MPFKISHGQSYYMIFKEKRGRFLKEKKGGREEKNYHKQIHALVCSPKKSKLHRQKCVLHSQVKDAAEI